MVVSGIQRFHAKPDSLGDAWSILLALDYFAETSAMAILVLL